MTQTLAATHDHSLALGSALAEPSHSTLTSTVPRQLVHRAAVAEVFLTGCRQLADDHYVISAQWPRAHSFFAPVSGHYDPMLAAETIRQVGTLLGHSAFGVPLDHQFLMWDLNYTVIPGHLAIGARPADLELDVVCSEIRRRGTRLTGLRYEVAIRHDGRVIATGGLGYTCASPELYRRLRGARLATAAVPLLPGTPVPPARVGRSSGSDVVLGPAAHPRCWQLRVDTQHPVLFDHYVDHVPGMVLLEAARQVAHAMAPGDAPLLPTSVHSTFSRYVEFGSPCWIEAEYPADDPTGLNSGLVVRAHQEGETVFTSTVTTAVPA
ncbi:ScbA/BarX family gamma-butyrolactone biosynthesis protein [Streptomyces apocyni]|uniref:ScbA/BarX family gamma-butyrolactone biosynthesis protein n=1 Tax=Streptomyces apocyni TaxID=2654677 RepID=UPI001E645A48|nr:ScbA/BarX family gamma-butyrolactone biosynthesis protein [Streptomyces apocyni]